jgi:hypothetical protein
MSKILETIKPVVEKSKYVSIDQKRLKKVCADFEADDIAYWMDAAPFDLSVLNDQDRLDFIFLFDALNFCYWGDPKWTVEYKGKGYDGAWGMIVALGKAVENNIPVLDAKYLSTISAADWANVLKGNVAIPLFEERLNIIHEIGSVLLEKYDGHFVNVLKKAKGDAMKHLDIVVTNFPSFNDHGVYRDEEVYFHKRAQLLVSDVYRTFKGKGYGDLKNIDQLSSFADYKIPQSLRKLGILVYVDDLARKVNNGIPLPKNSEPEMEIRANMIWAVELMKDEISKRIPDIRSMEVDSFLWLMGQNKSPDDKPYHLTETIQY